MDILKKFGERVRLLRMVKRLKQSVLAEVLGLSPSSACRMEQGTYDPRLSQLPGLAKELGCTLEELLRGLDGEGNFRVTITAD